MDDLGSARRELITTIDPGRDRRNAGEFARLERMQRVNEGRQTAIQEGWFSLPSDLAPDDQPDDIAGGQTHRAKLDRELRAQGVNKHTDTSSDARNMASRAAPSLPASRGGSHSTASPRPAMSQSHARPIQSTVRGQSPQLSQQTQSYTTYKFKSTKAQELSSSNALRVLSGLDPSLDSSRNGFMGKMRPDRGPPSVPSSNIGKKSKRKAGNAHNSGHPPHTPESASSRRLKPQVHPLFALGKLAINPEPLPSKVSSLPSEISSDANMQAFLGEKWGCIPGHNSGMAVSTPKISHTTQSNDSDQDFDDTASVSTESSSDDGFDDASTMAGLEDVYEKMLNTGLEDHQSVAQRESPQTTPEPNTPLHQKSIVCSASLMDDEPNKAEVQKLPEAMLDLSERQIQAHIQPVGDRKNDEHHRALASREAFEQWAQNNRGPAAHKPVTNKAQFINESYKSRELMKSKFAS